jgi:hypothetical protein
MLALKVIAACANFLLPITNFRIPHRGNADISPAKARRTPSSENYFIHFLCGLCVFAGNIPSFGCGLVALWDVV